MIRPKHYNYHNRSPTHTARKDYINHFRQEKLATVTREKWELISSHTARRSAATNMYLTGDDTARSISGDMFFRK